MGLESTWLHLVDFALTAILPEPEPEPAEPVAA